MGELGDLPEVLHGGTTRSRPAPCSIRGTRPRGGAYRQEFVDRFVELDSQTVETEALVELALDLAPAAVEPPPLVS